MVAMARQSKRSVSPTEAVIEQRMLFVGPLPPPRTGTHVSFQLLCDAVRARALPGHLEVIDTSQKHQKKNPRIASWANLRQCLKIAMQFRRKVRQADYVLVFGSNGFIFSMTPILRTLSGARPFYVHVCGGSLDQFANKLSGPMSHLLFSTLSRASGVVVQTEFLRDRLVDKLGDHVVASPNRRYRTETRAHPGAHSPLRLVYLSTVRRDKGIFVLLDCLARLHATGSTLQCDIYGELWPADEQEFRDRVEDLPNASYRGYVDPVQVATTMSQYDVLVLPTYYQGEGHPGVLVEAMMVGLPVVTTDFRSIPEVVQDGVQGLLVQPDDVESLLDALKQLEQDPSQVVLMGEQAVRSSERFDADHVLPEYLKHVGLLPVQAS